MKENRILLLIFTAISIGASVFAYKHSSNDTTPPPGWVPNQNIVQPAPVPPPAPTPPVQPEPPKKRRLLRPNDS